jgi:hypothetical protein
MSSFACYGMFEFRRLITILRSTKFKLGFGQFMLPTSDCSCRNEMNSVITLLVQQNYVKKLAIIKKPSPVG